MEKTTKNLIIFGLIAIGGILAFKYMGGSKSNGGQGGGEGGDDEGGGGNGGGGNGGGGGLFSQADLLRLKTIANDMFYAMDGCTTDNTALREAAAKVNNEREWQEVIRQYGTRTTTCFFGDYTGDLLGAIKDEGNKSDINEILSAKGITTLIQ